MKLKKIGLSLVLCLCSICTLFGLSGCGEVSLTTVQNNIKALEDTYTKYDTVFTQGICEGLNTDYLIKYGETVDKYITENKDGYVELRDIYNVTLVISNDYIDNNKEYIKTLTEDNLTDKMKKSLTKLNGKIVSYTKTIEDFVLARRNFMNYFEQFGNEITEKSSLAYLREFKKDYGKLVSKNIELSTQMAKTIENTEIFDLLKNTKPTVNDTKIVKEYIRAKLLPVFSEFKITELENNLNWNAQKDTATKQRIDVLLTKLNDQFETYKSRFVSSGETLQELKTAEMNNLFNVAENFFVEADAYFKALEKFDISKLAVDFDNDLEAYKKSNKLAEVYLEKMEQFINISLTNFMETVANIVY